MGQISAKFFKELFKENKTYEDISYIFRQIFSGSCDFYVILIKCFFFHPAYQKKQIGETVSKAVDELTLFYLLILRISYLFI